MQIKFSLHPYENIFHIWQKHVSTFLVKQKMYVHN
jgi:hypothetical protein